ncbi:MAG: prepilin-type N-terminal cleavage/methylation domain-containing protein [Candidatus Omnitrophica bacterium]|nr:prepilin-type N-terminal cleavage/methylation domain-containing protein [Candidatus Omnitrophota bacterium]
MRKRGFTLIETLVTVGIMTIIIGTFFETVTLAQRSWIFGQARLLTQETARLAMDAMVKELRLANFVNIADNHTVRFRVPVDTDGDNFLDVDNVGRLIYGADGTANYQIQYLIDCQSGRLLRRVLDAGGNLIRERVLANNVNPNQSSFTTETAGIGITNVGINIIITTEINNPGFANINFTNPVCPLCKGALNEQGGRYVCVKCGRTYPIIRTNLSTFVLFRN